MESGKKELTLSSQRTQRTQRTLRRERRREGKSAPSKTEGAAPGKGARLGRRPVRREENPKSGPGEPGPYKDKRTGRSACATEDGQATWRRQITIRASSRNRKPREAWYSWFLRYWDQENEPAVAAGCFGAIRRGKKSGTEFA